MNTDFGGCVLYISILANLLSERVDLSYHEVTSGQFFNTYVLFNQILICNP